MKSTATATKKPMTSSSPRNGASRPPPVQTKVGSSKPTEAPQRMSERPPTPQRNGDKSAAPSLFAKMRASGFAKVADRKLASAARGESALQNLVDGGGKIDLDVFSAARTGSLNLLKQLVSTGQPIEVSDETCRSPLHLAAGAGHIDVVEYLLECRASVHAQTRDNMWTPLHEASSGEIAELLIVAQADVNVADAWGMTPLHLAAKRGSIAVTRCLTQYRADIRAADDLGRSALHLAAAHGHRAVADELASLGADLDAADAHGRTALDCARAFGHLELTKTLEEMRGLLGAMGAGGTSLRSLPAGSPAKLTRGSNDKPAARPRTSSLGGGGGGGGGDAGGARVDAAAVAAAAAAAAAADDGRPPKPGTARQIMTVHK